MSNPPDCGCAGTDCVPRLRLSSPPGSALLRGRCARCESRVQVRTSHSRERTLAWLIAGMILYVPANLLPVMSIDGIQGRQEGTADLSGVISFWQAGAWDIAALIFIANVAVPATEFLALGHMLGGCDGERCRVSVSGPSLPSGGIHRPLVDAHVAVVGLTSALLQFKALGTAEPRAGIVFFCGVVVATMIAALSFDPRLIWDGEASNG